MRSGERPLGAVPRWIIMLLATCLVAQVGMKASIGSAAPQAEDLPTPPHPLALRIASFGEPATLARLVMVYLQSFDFHGGNSLPYRKLDYNRLVGWLRAIQSLDPLSEYPLFAASRIYAEVADTDRQRIMLEYIYQAYVADPNRHWPAMTHAAMLAKHRLKDLPLALKYAKAVDQLTTSKEVPLWAKQMEVFILEDMNELEAARIMLGGLLAAGQVKDDLERKYLESRLEKMSERLQSGTAPRAVR